MSRGTTDLRCPRSAGVRAPQDRAGCSHRCSRVRAGEGHPSEILRCTAGYLRPPTPTVRRAHDRSQLSDGDHRAGVHDRDRHERVPLG